VSYWSFNYDALLSTDANTMTFKQHAGLLDKCGGKPPNGCAVQFVNKVDPSDFNLPYGELPIEQFSYYPEDAPWATQLCDADWRKSWNSLPPAKKKELECQLLLSCIIFDVYPIEVDVPGQNSWR